MWHEGLEEASRLYFTDHNPDGMIAHLEPLHDLLEKVFYFYLRFQNSLLNVVGLSRALEQRERLPLRRCLAAIFMKRTKLAEGIAGTERRRISKGHGRFTMA